MADIRRDQKFGAEPVIIDNTIFSNCEFKESILVYTGGNLPSFTGCVFDRISFGFQAEASNTLTFMKVLYHMGFAGVIENTFAEIKNSPPESVSIKNNRTEIRE